MFGHHTTLRLAYVVAAEVATARRWTTRGGEVVGDLSAAAEVEHPVVVEGEAKVGFRARNLVLALVCAWRNLAAFVDGDDDGGSYPVVTNPSSSQTAAS